MDTRKLNKVLFVSMLFLSMVIISGCKTCNDVCSREETYCVSEKEVCTEK
jgi:hypothetical protein